MANNNPDQDVDMKKLENDIAQLRDDLTKLSEQVAERVSERGDGVRSAIDARVKALRDEIEELSGRAQRTGRESFERVEDTIRERPLTSMLAAFGVGMLVSHLFGRR